MSFNKTSLHQKPLSKNNSSSLPQIERGSIFRSDGLGISSFNSCLQATRSTANLVSALKVKHSRQKSISLENISSTRGGEHQRVRFEAQIPNLASFPVTDMLAIDQHDNEPLRYKDDLLKQPRISCGIIAAPMSKVLHNKAIGRVKKKGKKRGSLGHNQQRSSFVSTEASGNVERNSSYLKLIEPFTAEQVIKSKTHNELPINTS